MDQFNRRRGVRVPSLRGKISRCDFADPKRPSTATVLFMDGSPARSGLIVLGLVYLEHDPAARESVKTAAVMATVFLRFRPWIHPVPGIGLYARKIAAPMRRA